MKTIREMIDLVEGKDIISIAELVAKVQSGRYRLSQAQGQRYYTLDHIQQSTGEWVPGVRTHTSTARAAAKQLEHVISQNGHFHY